MSHIVKSKYYKNLMRLPVHFTFYWLIIHPCLACYHNVHNLPPPQRIDSSGTFLCLISLCFSTYHNEIWQVTCLQVLPYQVIQNSRADRIKPTREMNQIVSIFSSIINVCVYVSLTFSITTHKNKIYCESSLEMTTSASS